jgi:hypothetical protein
LPVALQATAIAAYDMVHVAVYDMVLVDFCPGAGAAFFGLLAADFFTALMPVLLSSDDCSAAVLVLRPRTRWSMG